MKAKIKVKRYKVYEIQRDGNHCVVANFASLLPAEQYLDTAGGHDGLYIQEETEEIEL